MSVARPNAVGATRVCPHCKATVLQSANICPGCQHHLRFNTVNAEPQTKALLGAPEQYQLITLIPMGYPADGFKRPYRKPVWARIHLETWDKTWPKPSAPR